MFAGGGGGGRGGEVKLDFLIRGVTRHFLPLRPFILLTIKNRGRASGLSSSSETVIEFRSKKNVTEYGRIGDPSFIYQIDKKKINSFGESRQLEQISRLTWFNLVAFKSTRNENSTHIQ